MTEAPVLNAHSPLFRPAKERFHSQRGWLDSWHSFSFAGHHHPDWMGFGPLRVINDDVIAAGQGFGMHPHRDMEIITVMVDGQLNHRDSMGNSGVIRAGDVQRMSAGTGVVHSEVNEGEQPCRLLQIWIEPDQSNLPPSYEQRQIAIGDGWTPLIAPDQTGVMAIARPVRLWRAQPKSGTTLQLPALSHPRTWLQMIDGSATLGSADHQNTGPSSTTETTSLKLSRGDGIGLGPNHPMTSLKSTSDGCDLLLFALA